MATRKTHAQKEAEVAQLHAEGKQKLFAGTQHELRNHVIAAEHYAHALQDLRNALRIAHSCRPKNGPLIAEIEKLMQSGEERFRFCEAKASEHKAATNGSSFFSSIKNAFVRPTPVSTPPSARPAPARAPQRPASAQPSRAQPIIRAASVPAGRPSRPATAHPVGPNAPEPRPGVRTPKHGHTGPFQVPRQSPTHAAGATGTTPTKAPALPPIKGVDPEMQAAIMNDVLDRSPSVCWDDIAGLSVAKKTLEEIVILPASRPDLFTGIRSPPKGLLLFGPPGTGKTLLAKAVATEANCTFFSISASSLTSKWHGQGEKLVRALFAVATELQPAVIFMDEVDSILGARSESEHEASRRLKTEFLVQFDGVGTSSAARVLVMGATNRPQELDEAARRRFTKRIYIPLPDSAARIYLIKSLLKGQKTAFSERDYQRLADMTDGYSGSDLTALVKDAAMGPIRDIPPASVRSVKLESVRPISVQDFQRSMSTVRASVSQEELGSYVKWNLEFGSAGV